MGKIEKLEQTTALRALLCIYENEKIWHHKLMEELKITHAPTLNRGLLNLKELGLIDDIKEPPGRGSKRWLIVTEKGRKIAEKVKEIEEGL